jgi:ankyrin repeat protein
VLIDAGADVNARDKDGRTALMHANIKNSNPDVLSMLIDAGADLQATNNIGETAYSIMAENDNLNKTDVFQKFRDIY